jgi:hypothetical protein
VVATSWRAQCVMNSRAQYMACQLNLLHVTLLLFLYCCSCAMAVSSKQILSS